MIIDKQKVGKVSNNMWSKKWSSSAIVTVEACIVADLVNIVFHSTKYLNNKKVITNIDNKKV